MKKLALLASAAAIALLVSACGKGGEQADENAAPATQQETTVPANDTGSSTQDTSTAPSTSGSEAETPSS